MPFGHALVRCVVSVSRISLDVVGADNPFAAEGRCENGGIARHRESGECLARYTGQTVQHVALDCSIVDIVEESPDLRTSYLHACIWYEHHAGFQILLRHWG